MLWKICQPLYSSGDMRKIIYFLVLIVISFSSLAQRSSQPSLSNEEKKSIYIDNLLKTLTLNEKIGQLRLISVGGENTKEKVLEMIKKGEIGGIFNTVVQPEIKRMQDAAMQSPGKVPLFFAYDVIHGQRTIFPVNLGLAATWDRQAIKTVGEISALESTEDGLNITWAPMVDLSREPRWGRVSEGFGEDPYLVSEMGRLLVTSMQKDRLDAPHSLAATVKHFALYGAVEGGREYNRADMSEREMFQNYLVPYKKAIDAGSEAVMVSLSSVNGIPATSNKWLLTELLRQQWQFDGVVISDHGAIGELIRHGVAEDAKDAVRLAIKAGITMSMSDDFFLEYIPELIKEGKLTEAEIDKACRYVLSLKYDMGLLANPYRYINPDLSVETMFSEQRLHRTEARDVARRSIVLLKNKENILPLAKDQTIALIGPLADSHRDVMGSWSAAGQAKQAVTVREGLQSAANNPALIHYALGANVSNDRSIIGFLNSYEKTVEFDERTPETLIAEAIQTAEQADIIVAVVGEAQGMAHESSSRTNISIPDNQKQLIRALKATGKPLILVLMNGRPLTLLDESEQADALLETWFLGTEGGNAIADVLFGDYNPSGKLPMSFPLSVGQLPVYYNHLSTGRPRGEANLGKYTTSYFDSPNDPLYPFGFGLSYTTFNLNHVQLSSENMTRHNKITVTAEVENSGQRAGQQTVQFYLQDITASVSRPVKELVGFENIKLNPGEKGQVTFTITPEMLKFWNDKMKFVAEPGKFNLYIGFDSTTNNVYPFNLLDQ